MRESGSEVKRIEANLVQGRWQQALMPQVTGYQGEKTTTSKVLPLGEDDIFDYREPGFSLAVDSIGSLSKEDVSKIFGQIGALLSVSIFEEREEAIEIMGPTRSSKLFATPEDEKKLKTTYFAKPYETFCQENVNFMLKHLNQTVFQSGIHSLYSSEAMHDTYYKQATLIVEKQVSLDGHTSLHMHWKLAYVV